MITWSDLGLAIVALAAVAGGALGLLTTFAGGMSDSPSDGAAMSRKGCIGTLVAIAVLAIVLWALFT